MADLAAIIQEKNLSDTQWRENRQMKRDNITSIQDAGIVQITSDPDTYARYLNMQADNPTYSPGNIALVMEQMPEATIFGTQERWRSMGRFVVDSEQLSGVSIFARSPDGKGYSIADAYDIGQTGGRAMKAPYQLQDGSKEMETALKILLNYSKVPPTVSEELPIPAYYDPQSLSLLINPNYADSEAFAAIAAEVAHSRFHNKGYNGDYLKAESDLDAQSVSYILCRRFGVSRDMPDVSRVPKLYEDWSVESRKSILDGMQDTSKNIGNSIEKSIAPQQRTIPHTRRPPTRQGPR